jgi:hypothetical protein
LTRPIPGHQEKRILLPVINRHHFLVSAALCLTISPGLSVLFFILAALISAWEGRSRLRTRESLICFGIILLVSGWFWHQWVLPEKFSPGTVSFTDYVPLFFFFFALSRQPFSEREIKNVLLALLLTVPQQFLLALGERYWHWGGRYCFPARKLPIIDIYIGPSEPGLATSASFFNPNILALYCLIGIILSFSLLPAKAGHDGPPVKSPIKKAGGAVPLLGLLLGLTLLIWTGSRNGWFFAMAALLAFARFRTRRLYLGLGLVMLALTLVAIGHRFFPIPGADFLLPESLTSKLTVFSQDRARYYPLVWDLILIKPLTGWGIGTFPLLVPKSVFGHQVLHTHSLPLQLALEVGLPAAAAVLGGLVFLICSTGRKILRKEKRTGAILPLDRGLLITVAAVLLMQVFDLALLMTYRLNFLFWLCLAIPYSRSGGNRTLPGEPNRYAL